MIIGFAGTPGSGKTYEAVKKILDNLRMGRVVYTNIDGIFDPECQEMIKVVCGLSDLALVRLSLSTMQRYEKGDNIPDVGTLEKIAALGVDLHWLVTGKLEHLANRLPSEGKREDEKLSEYLMRIQPCPCCGCLGRRP